MRFFSSFFLTTLVYLLLAGLSPVVRPASTSGALTYGGEDFIVTVILPSALTRGTSERGLVSLTSLNGFSGIVSLEAVLSPSNVPNPPRVLLDPVRVSLPPDEMASSQLTIVTSQNTTIGTYSVTVVGTGQFVSRSDVSTVRVQKLILKYAISRYGNSHPGGYISLVNRFTNVGAAKTQITGLLVMTGWASYAAISPQPFQNLCFECEIPPRPVILGSGEIRTVNMTVWIPSSTSVGNHTVEVKIVLSYTDDPSFSDWTNETVFAKAFLQVEPKPTLTAVMEFVPAGLGIYVPSVLVLSYVVIRRDRKRRHELAFGKAPREVSQIHVNYSSTEPLFVPGVQGYVVVIDDKESSRQT